MRDLRADRSVGTAPLPDVGPPPAQRQHVAPGEPVPTPMGDGAELRSVPSMAQSAKLTFGDPVGDASDKGAENLAEAVLLSGDRKLIDKVKVRLGNISDAELRAISKGTPLTDKQKSSLDANEKGLLLECVTSQGTEAAVKAMKSQSDSG